MNGSSSTLLPRRFMAIDNGSNAIKYRLWQVDSPSAIEQIAERRFPIRLGEGVFDVGRIAPNKIAEALAAYGEIRRDMERLAVNDHCAVGTSALREAKNSGEFIEAIEAASGIRIKVIEDVEEARLIALGAIGRPEGLTGCHVLIDVGGGSSEIIFTRDSRIEWAKSLPVGAVRLTNHFFPDTPPLDDQYTQATRAISGILDQELTGMPTTKEVRALGTGGTMVALLLMKHHRRFPAELFADQALGRLDRAQLETLAKALRPMTTSDIVTTFHADPRRAEILLAGALIMLRLLERLGLTAIELGRGGVSEGLLWDWLSRFTSTQKAG